MATGVAAAISFVATPAFASAAQRIGLVVHPRSDRWHRAVTPLLGGAAMALGALVALAALGPAQRGVAVVILCALLAFGLGLLDDFRHLAPATKLVGQVIVASVLALGGVHAELVPIVPVSFVITVLWVVVMMNAVNLLDNMDGLAAGVSAIGAAVLVLTAASGNVAAPPVAAVTLGAALGFLFHNFHPARVFMGDAGSQLLGLLLAAAALLHTSSGAANVGLALLGPLAAAALPIFDTALVATSRGIAGIPISQGGRDHSSHRLAALGLTDRGAVIVLYLVAGGFALLGLLAASVSALLAPLVILGVVLLILFGVFLHDVDVYGRQRQLERPPVFRALTVYGRFGAEIGLDVVLLTTAYYLSYAIRYESQPQSDWLTLFARSLPIVIPIQLATLVITGVYRTLWRYLGLSDVVVLVRAVAIGAAASGLALLVAYRFQDYSRAVLILDAFIAAALLMSTRVFLLWMRAFFADRPRAGARRTMIVGATERGVMALRLLRRSGDAPYHVVGFIDDDPGKRYRRVAGVPIVGTTDQVADEIARLRADLVVVAIDPGDEAAKKARAACETLQVECREFLVPV